MATAVGRSRQLSGKLYNALAADSKEIRLISLQPGLAFRLQHGDRLFLVGGACLPLLLRPMENGRWTFRGLAYVHGIGQGQLVDFVPGSRLKNQALVLC